MAVTGSWEDRRADERSATNADQTELAALRFGSTTVDEGTRDERLAGALDEYEAPHPEGLASWAATDETMESAASDLGRELARRRNLLGHSYPFEINGNQLVYRGSAKLVYEFCLAATCAPSKSAGEFKRIPRAFERLCRDLVRSFLGAGAGAHRTGWSGDQYQHRPGRFRAVAEELHELTGEFIWSPRSGYPDDPLPAHVKDLGLDFVAWKLVGDGRPGGLIVICQCACGEWEGKYGELSAERLDAWFRPHSVTPPVRALAVACHIPNAAHFDEANSRAGLTFDRARLALLAERSLEGDAEELPDRLAELIKLVIPAFQRPQ